jgi:hypothetical protein
MPMLSPKANMNFSMYQAHSHMYVPFAHGIDIRGGGLKNYHWKVFEKGMKIQNDVTHRSAFLTTYQIFVG